MNSLTIECQKCGSGFEFGVGEQMWYVEKGFPAPKKCKNCKRLEKNKKTYTYTPSKREIELKNTMITNQQDTKKSKKMNMFDVLGEENEENEVIEKVVEKVKEKKSWADMVEEEEDMWNKSGVTWAQVVLC